MNYTLVTEDTNKEKYIFDSERNCTAYYLEENGVVTTAEQYEYVPYWKGTTAQDDPKSIVTQAKKDTLYKTALNSFIFAEGDTETTTLDQFNNALKTTTSAIKLNDSGSNTQTTTVDYIYDDDQKLTEEKTTIVTTAPAQTIVAYKRHNYNSQGW